MIPLSYAAVLSGTVTMIVMGWMKLSNCAASTRNTITSEKRNTSPIAPDASRPVPANPLIDAARNLAAQSSALKKEI